MKSHYRNLGVQLPFLSSLTRLQFLRACTLLTTPLTCEVAWTSYQQTAAQVFYPALLTLPYLFRNEFSLIVPTALSALFRLCSQLKNENGVRLLLMPCSGPQFRGKQHPDTAEKGKGQGLPHWDTGTGGCVVRGWDPGHCQSGVGSAWCQLCVSGWATFTVPLRATVLVTATERGFLQELPVGPNHDLAGTFPAFAHRSLC